MRQAARDTPARSYGHAVAEGYRWHEFGDLHLLLPERSDPSRNTHSNFDFRAYTPKTKLE
ncbi:MAG: hypothetical protein ACRD0K_16660 [Egibacteraceae bacterium]